MTVINHTRNKPRCACRNTDLAGQQHVLSVFPIPVPHQGTGRLDIRSRRTERRGVRWL